MPLEEPPRLAIRTWSEGPVLHGCLEASGRPAGAARLLQHLAGSAEPCLVLARTLAALPLEAFFWECAPLAAARPEAPFRWVVLPAPALARAAPDTRSFRELLDRREPVVTVPNLGGDALLVVPTRRAAPAAYVHLARFVREAPTDQVAATFQELAWRAARWLEHRPDPLWLSTSGLGVHWVHLRLDERPKYVTYLPFRHPPA